MVSHEPYLRKDVYHISRICTILSKIRFSRITIRCPSSWQLDPGPQPVTTNAGLPILVRVPLLGVVSQLFSCMDTFRLWFPPSRTDLHPRSGSLGIVLLLIPSNIIVTECTQLYFPSKFTDADKLHGVVYLDRKSVV